MLRKESEIRTEGECEMLQNMLIFHETVVNYMSALDSGHIKCLIRIGAQHRSVMETGC